MLEAIVGIIGTGLLGVGAWGVALSSRVSVLEADKVSLRELLNIQLADITRRLGRIENKLDHKEDEE
jgi:hypothetical protein